MKIFIFVPFEWSFLIHIHFQTVFRAGHVEPTYAEQRQVIHPAPLSRWRVPHVEEFEERLVVSVYNAIRTLQSIVIRLKYFHHG